MPPSESDPRLNFVIDAENRGDAAFDAAEARIQKIMALNASLSRDQAEALNAQAAAGTLTEKNAAAVIVGADKQAVASEGLTRRVTSAADQRAQAEISAYRLIQAEADRTAATQEMAAVREAAAAEAAARRNALAAERVSGGLMMVARSGEASARGMRSLLGGATDLAFAFGPQGAWLTAISIAGMALSEFWDHEQKEAQKTAQEFEKVLDVIRKIDPRGQQAVAQNAQAKAAQIQHSIEMLQAQQAKTSGEAWVGYQKIIEAATIELQKYQRVAGELNASADFKRHSQNAEASIAEMQRSLEDLRRRKMQADAQAAEQAKTGVGPMEDPAKLQSAIDRQLATLREFYAQEHQWLGEDTDQKLAAIKVGDQQFRQEEARAAQEHRYMTQKEEVIAQRNREKEAARQLRVELKMLSDEIGRETAESLKSMKKDIGSIGALPTPKEVAEGARKEIAGDSGTSVADKALIAGYDKRQKIADAAHKKELEAERRQQSAMEQIIRGSIDGLVRAHEDLGRALLKAALQPEITYLEAQASKQFTIATADALAQDYKGAAEHAAAGAAYVAGAMAMNSFAAGGGGGYGGGGGGGGGGSSSTPGTFRPSDQSQGSGSFTLNLITKHPASPDVVQSIAYELNRSNVLKRPPIQIPPTAGLQPFQG